ncbi:hypothetical protein ACIBH1_38445 [Nonomuraea sp. NPDC050663]|uniref:hypothetical protein n=1 Tax=Nonomuraea sp. NPDC050663 TaxID=3364370 RepID=UPI0037988997
MTNQHDILPELMQEDVFEVAIRGYNRRQVHDHMLRTRNQIRDLEERLARAIDQAEQSRIELAEARRRMVEAPQSYDDLSPRLAQILKLGEEEAASKRSDAEADAVRRVEGAQAEADRLVTSARETSDKILTSAQAEAERRVAEATEAAERMLAQAGADAEETLTTARAEAEEGLREARGEADRMLTAARVESEQLVESARAEAESTLGSARAEADATLRTARGEAETTLTSAQQRANSLDEHTGRRVSYLTDTHGEVVRRLSEISVVLADLMDKEAMAGELIPTAPPAPLPSESPRGELVVVEEIGPEPAPEEEVDDEITLNRLPSPQ